MEVIGFKLTKIQANTLKTFKFPFSVDTNLHFDSIEKEKSDLLKSKEMASLIFICTISYHHNQNKSEKQDEKKENKQAEIILEGAITISLSQEESKELFKSWKKKELPKQFREPIFNIIWRKCMLRSLSLEDELGIPAHINLPHIKLQ